MKAVWNEFLSKQHQKEERKKQEATSKMAYLKVQNERKNVLRVEEKKKKNGSRSVIGGAIYRSCISSLVGWGL